MKKGNNGFISSTTYLYLYILIYMYIFLEYTFNTEDVDVCVHFIIVRRVYTWAHIFPCRRAVSLASFQNCNLKFIRKKIVFRAQLLCCFFS